MTRYVSWEGYIEGIQCAVCHDADSDSLYYIAGRTFQYMKSKHYTGGGYLENSSTCAGCHTTEGFIQFSRGQNITGHPNASPPGCFTCHSPHSRADFSLRIEYPVTMLAGVEGVADYTFDYGKGNLCASCHKPRSISPKPDPTKTATTDVITITSSRWYQHYGVQGSMLSGHGGFEFQGYNYTNSYHTASTLNSRRGLHHLSYGFRRKKSSGWAFYVAGIRWMEMLDGCNTVGCHNNNLYELNYDNVQTYTQAFLDSLQVLLLSRGWITASGTVNASVTNPLVISPAYLAGAMYNYFFVEHDGSLGVHNSIYSHQLLDSSIDVLNSN